jgi:hypothetical protein
MKRRIPQIIFVFLCAIAQTGAELKYADAIQQLAGSSGTGEIG